MQNDVDYSAITYQYQNGRIISKRNNKYNNEKLEFTKKYKKRDNLTQFQFQSPTNDNFSSPWRKEEEGEKYHDMT